MAELWVAAPGPGGGQRRTAGGSAGRAESEHDRWRREHGADMEGKGGWRQRA